MAEGSVSRRLFRYYRKPGPSLGTTAFLDRGCAFDRSFYQANNLWHRVIEFSAREDPSDVRRTFLTASRPVSQHHASRPSRTSLAKRRIKFRGIAVRETVLRIFSRSVFPALPPGSFSFRCRGLLRSGNRFRRIHDRRRNARL